MVVAILRRWSAGAGAALHGPGRMVVQLALVGYVLTFIFGTGHPAVVLGTLTVMLAVAGWISLRPVARRRRAVYPRARRVEDLQGRPPDRQRYPMPRFAFICSHGRHDGRP